MKFDDESSLTMDSVPSVEVTKGGLASAKVDIKTTDDALKRLVSSFEKRICYVGSSFTT
jgi:hypothetical protein